MKTQKLNSDPAENAIAQKQLWTKIPETSQVNISGGISFPCDGPGRGGTCTISAWDAF